MVMKIERSSGNVFRDLGFETEEAESLRLRAELMAELKGLIRARKLKQNSAAQPFWSDPTPNQRFCRLQNRPAPYCDRVSAHQLLQQGQSRILGAKSSMMSSVVLVGREL